MKGLMKMVITLTKENFEAEVMHSDKPVMIDFWASWCGPCMMVSPIVDEISEEVTNTKICKVNVDEQPELAAKFGIDSIPALFLIKDGKVADSMVGARSKAVIMSMIK